MTTSWAGEWPQPGLQVKILPYVVETLNPALSLKDYLLHQLRWARTYRVCRPKGYLAYGITHALVYSLALGWGANAAPWALGLIAATLALREILASLARYCLGSEPTGGNFLLLPLKDLLSFALWALSFTGNRVTWGEDTHESRRKASWWNYEYYLGWAADCHPWQD